MVVAHHCGHGLQIRAIVHERFFYISERSGFLQTGDKIRIYKTDIYKSISNGDGKSITKTINVFK